jgi:hypothetical protein
LVTSVTCTTASTYVTRPTVPQAAPAAHRAAGHIHGGCR